MVKITGGVPVAAILDFAVPVRECIPNRGAFPVQIPRTFDLVSCRSGSKGKIRAEVSSGNTRSNEVGNGLKGPGCEGQASKTCQFEPIFSVHGKRR